MAVLGHDFHRARGTGPEGYPVDQPDRAHAVGRAQLEAYLTWRDKGLIGLDRFGALRVCRGLSEIRGGMGVAGIRAGPAGGRAAGPAAQEPGDSSRRADGERGPDPLAGGTWLVERPRLGGRGAVLGDALAMTPRDSALAGRKRPDRRRAGLGSRA